jgi:hypothetical protein
MKTKKQLETQKVVDHVRWWTDYHKDNIKGNLDDQGTFYRVILEFAGPALYIYDPVFREKADAFAADRVRAGVGRWSCASDDVLDVSDFVHFNLFAEGYIQIAREYLPNLDKLSPFWAKGEDAQGILSYNQIDKDGNITNRRMRAKIGRFLTSTAGLGSLVPEAVIELLTQYLVLNYHSTSFQIDSGEDIWNNYRNSVGGSSCMTGDVANYVGLYVDNPDKIRQLVCVSGRNSGRAILWTLDDGNCLLDRIYADSGAVMVAMREYAANQGWLVRQINGSITNGDHHLNSLELSKLRVSGLSYNEDEIPYLDTMYYGFLRFGKLDLACGSSSVCGELYLQQTDGSLGENREACARCGEYGNEDDMTYLECEDGSVCEECLREYYIYCPHCGYYRPAAAAETVNNEVWCAECVDRHAVECVDCGCFVSTNDAVCPSDSDESYCSDCADGLSYCDNCRGTFADDDSLTEVNGDTLCKKCAANKVAAVV